MKLMIDVESADAAMNDRAGFVQLVATVTLQSAPTVGVPVDSELHLSLDEAKKLHLALGRVLKNLA